jgi:APA family basic amino acid/polyamine antiporter
MTQESLLRNLGMKETLALVIGDVIGTGVFLKAAIMANNAGSAWWVIAAWIFAGVLSLAGAFCYAELGATFPRAGGEYVFLREAYGDLVAFLFGWMRFWIAAPGSIAIYGVGAATFLSSVIDLPSAMVRNMVAIGFILAFTALNCLSVRFGGRLQAILTALKMTSVIGLAFALFAFAKSASWQHLQAPNGGDGWMGWSAFGSTMLAALWAYDGWNNMPMAAGEVRDPAKTIPIALIGGMAAVLVMYTGINLAYFYALPFSEVVSAHSKLNPSALPVAAKAASEVFGLSAAGMLSIAFVISALGAMNGSILTNARVPFAMARDGLFFSKLGEVSHSTRVPVIAILVQGAFACLLAVSGSFDQLTDYVVFASWIFYAAATASLFVFRRRHAHKRAGSVFRTPGYPLVPLVFVAVSALLLLNTLVTAPWESGIGLVFIAAGVPVYFLFRRRRVSKNNA